MNHFDPFLKSHREAAAKRRSSFEDSGRDAKASAILAALDSACKMLGRPRLAGKEGVRELMELPATAWLEVHRVAKCARPPSQETLKGLMDEIRGRS